MKENLKQKSENRNNKHLSGKTCSLAFNHLIPIEIDTPRIIDNSKSLNNELNISTINIDKQIDNNRKSLKSIESKINLFENSKFLIKSSKYFNRTVKKNSSILRRKSTLTRLFNDSIYCFYIVKYNPKLYGNYSVLGIQLIKNVSSKMGLKNKLIQCIKKNTSYLKKCHRKSLKLKKNVEDEIDQGNKKRDSIKFQDENAKKYIESVYHNSDLKYFPKNYYITLSYPKKRDTTFFPSVNETKREKLISKYIIHHESFFRSTWDFLIFIWIMYTLLVTPIYLSFFPNSYLLSQFEIFIEVLLIIDFLLNFFTTFRDEDKVLIYLNKEILIKYISSWFFYDLFQIIPFEMIFSKSSFYHFIQIVDCNFSININILKWSKIFRIGKLLKVQTTGRFFKKFKLVSDNSINRLLKFLIIFSLLSHVFSCLFVYVGKICVYAKNWIIISELKSSDSFDIYLASLYFNLQTLYTIGNGDIFPINFVERIYSCLLIISGLFIFFYGFSCIYSIVNTNNTSSRKFINKKLLLDQINIENNINSYLYNKILIAIKEEDINEKEKRILFIKSLPLSLQNEIISSMYKSLIKYNDFFNNQSNEFVNYVMPLLEYRKIKKGDIILCEGEMVEEIYLVSKGILNLQLGSDYDNVLITQLGKNQYFGDVLININKESCFELKCKSTIAEMLILKKSNYLKIKKSFNSNIMNILENSLTDYKIFLEKKKIQKFLFKFCGTAELVKKKLKQINKHKFKRNFNNFYEKGLVMNEEYTAIYQYSNEEMRNYLSYLDESLSNSSEYECFNNNEINKTENINNSVDDKKFNLFHKIKKKKIRYSSNIRNSLKRNTIFDQDNKNISVIDNVVIIDKLKNGIKDNIDSFISSGNNMLIKESLVYNLVKDEKISDVGCIKIESKMRDKDEYKKFNYKSTNQLISLKKIKNKEFKKEINLFNDLNTDIKKKNNKKRLKSLTYIYNKTKMLEFRNHLKEIRIKSNYKKRKDSFLFQNYSIEKTININLIPENYDKFSKSYNNKNRVVESLSFEIIGNPNSEGDKIMSPNLSFKKKKKQSSLVNIFPIRIRDVDNYRISVNNKHDITNKDSNEKCIIETAESQFSKLDKLLILINQFIEPEIIQKSDKKILLTD